MVDLDLEPVGAAHGCRDVGRPRGVDLGRDPADGAVEVAVLAGRQDVVLLATVRTVKMPDEPELLEDVQRSVHRGGGRRRVDPPAAFDELGPGDVAVGRRERLDDRPALRGRPEAASAKAVGDLGPGRRW